MDKIYKESLIKLESSINDMDVEANYSIQRIETAIRTILSCLSELKNHVLEYGFDNINDEIRFFKYQKPNIVAKLIYFNSIYKIEARKPYGNGKTIKKYINNELEKLKKYFDNNLEFYKSYRTNSTYLDEKYFIRGKHDIKLSLDTYYFETDHNFTTSHDYKVAKIIANDLIQVYLEDQLTQNSQKEICEISPLSWTASKAALIELIYALHAQGVFNNGSIDIKFIAKTFESAFNIDLGDFYHTFMELKARKINRTKFLDSLCNALIKKMDERDER